MFILKFIHWSAEMPFYVKFRMKINKNDCWEWPKTFVIRLHKIMVERIIQSNFYNRKSQMHRVWISTIYFDIQKIDNLEMKSNIAFFSNFTFHSKSSDFIHSLYLYTYIDRYAKPSLKFDYLNVSFILLVLEKWPMDTKFIRSLLNWFSHYSLSVLLHYCLALWGLKKKNIFRYELHKLCEDKIIFLFVHRRCGRQDTVDDLKAN